MNYMKRDPKITSKIMKTIKSRNTKVEIIFAKLLRANKLKYRKHYNIRGKPDFVLLKHKIAIFLDGDFWHGNGWKLRGFKTLEESIKTNKEFWVNKIKNNVSRDRTVNKFLRSKGWKVFRFWESKIKKEPGKWIQKVKKYINRVVNPT
ncbi:MAG: very short patch repair endonuclease [Candidatus Omnitrophota bacterium]